MNVKISEMTSATSLDGTELIPIVQSGVSKKTTVAQMCPAITQVSLTPQSSSITIYANHSCAIEFPTGKLVTICASIRGVSVSSGSWGNIATIQEGYRPVGEEAYAYITVANNNYVIQSTYVATSGVIGIKPTSSISGADVRVVTSYYVPNSN